MKRRGSRAVCPGCLGVPRQKGSTIAQWASLSTRRVKDGLQFNLLGEDRTFDDYQAPLIIGRATNRKRDVIAFEVQARRLGY